MEEKFSRKSVTIKKLQSKNGWTKCNNLKTTILSNLVHCLYCQNIIKKQGLNNKFGGQNVTVF
jgi:hypothetical protein